MAGNYMVVKQGMMPWGGEWLRVGLSRKDGGVVEVEAKEEEVEVIGGGGAAGKGKRYCRWWPVGKGGRQWINK
jgi:hypothetical protein